MTAAYWIDATDPTFGADPTGVADSTVALQAWINAVSAVKGTGFLPKGAYAVTSTLKFQMARECRFISNSSSGNDFSTVIKWNGAAGGTVLLFNRCWDLYWYGISPANGTHNYGVGFDVDELPADGTGIATSCTFEAVKMELRNTGAFGMRFSHLSLSNVERMVFRNVQIQGVGTNLYGISVQHNQADTYSYHDCSFNFLDYGIDALSNFTCYNCNFGNNRIADVHISQVCTASFFGGLSQSSTAFFVGPDNGGAAGCVVLLDGMAMAPPTNAGIYISTNLQGSVVATGCDFASGQYIAGWRVDPGGNFFASGCIFPNATIFANTAKVPNYQLENCSYEYSGGQGACNRLPDVRGAKSAAFLKNLSYGGLPGGGQRTGLKLIGGGLFVQKIAAPVNVTVAPTGRDDGVAYSYYIVAHDSAGNASLPSTVVTTMHGAAIPSATDFNMVSWNVTPTSLEYDVIRVAGGLAQGSISLNLQGHQCKDTGLVASAYTAVLRSVSADSALQGLTTLGGVAAAITSVSADHAATLDDHTVIVTGATTITLPLAGAAPGQELEIINNDSTLATTVARAGSNTIEGATIKTLSARYSKVKLRSDGVSTWYVLASIGAVT